MTVHKAKGLEWNKVVVAVMPSKNDKIKIADMYSSPKIIGNSQANEFVRIYYVACSRAIGCERKEIENSLKSFVKKSGLTIDYEFIE